MINITLTIFIFLCLINNVISKEKISTKCGSPDIITKNINNIQNKKQKKHSRRKLDSDGFQDFNIILEKKNIETEIYLNYLSIYKQKIINAMNEAVKAMKSLLKVKPLDCYSFNEDFLEDYDFYYWDKAKFGITKNNKKFYTCDFDIDLLILQDFIIRKR